MTKVLLVGSDSALLEGIAQTLTGLGHGVCLSPTVGEASDICMDTAPSIAVVSADELARSGGGSTLPLSVSGALIVYTTEPAERPTLPTRLQRATLGHVMLPLERQRLIALVQHYESRAQVTGRAEAAQDSGELRRGE